MDVSVFVARIIAIIYLSAGVGMFLRGSFYKDLIDSLQKSPAFLYLSGFIAIIFGYTMVHFHNIWVDNWRTLITLFGWIALIKGIMLLAYPKPLTKAMVLFSKNEQALKPFGILALVLGIIFAYFGFFAG